MLTFLREKSVFLQNSDKSPIDHSELAGKERRDCAHITQEWYAAKFTEGKHSQGKTQAFQKGTEIQTTWIQAPVLMQELWTKEASFTYESTANLCFYSVHVSYVIALNC